MKRGAVCLGSDEGAEKRNKGDGGSLKLAGARGETEREKGEGGGSGRGHTEQEGVGGSAFWTDTAQTWRPRGPEG
jgi:hypothetical protein